MKVIDARRGRVVAVGEVVDYGMPPPYVTFVDSEGEVTEDGTHIITTSNPRLVPNPNQHREWWRLLAVRERWFSADAQIEYHHTNGNVTTEWVPLVVSYTHPEFFLRKIGIVPT